MGILLDGMTNSLIQIFLAFLSTATYIISVVLYGKSAKKKSINRKRAVITLIVYAIVHLFTVNLLLFYPETASGYGYLNRAWFMFSLLLVAMAVGFGVNTEDKKLKQYIPCAMTTLFQVVISMSWAIALSFTPSQSYSSRYYYNLIELNIWGLNGEAINLIVIALNVILLLTGQVIYIAKHSTARPEGAEKGNGVAVAVLDRLLILVAGVFVLFLLFLAMITILF